MQKAVKEGRKSVQRNKKDKQATAVIASTGKTLHNLWR